jgi:acyl carrier protein
MPAPMASADEIAARIRGYLKNEILLDQSADVSDSTPLLTGLVDSTGLMELVAFIEDEFDVTLDYADVDAVNFRTTADIARLVSAKAQGS